MCKKVNDQMTEKEMVYHIKKGLKAHIKERVGAFNVTTVEDLIDQAKRIEKSGPPPEQTVAMFAQGRQATHYYKQGNNGPPDQDTDRGQDRDQGQDRYDDDQGQDDYDQGEDDNYDNDDQAGNGQDGHNYGNSNYNSGFRGKCFYCDRQGHMVYDCWRQMRDREDGIFENTETQANAARAARNPQQRKRNVYFANGPATDEGQHFDQRLEAQGQQQPGPNAQGTFYSANYSMMAMTTADRNAQERPGPSQTQVANMDRRPALPNDFLTGPHSNANAGTGIIKNNGWTQPIGMDRNETRYTTDDDTNAWLTTIERTAQDKSNWAALIASLTDDEDSAHKTTGGPEANLTRYRDNFDGKYDDKKRVTFEHKTAK